MPTFRITSPDGKTYEVTAPDGATPEQALARIRGMSAQPTEKPPAKPFGQQLNEGISDIPRQVGLTVRHGVEGLGDVADFISSPIRAGLNAVGANIRPGSGQYVADKLGLPQPQNATERGVGDAVRLMAGSVLPVGLAAKTAQATTGATQQVAKAMAANPLQQAASAGSAGGAGGYTRETGGNELSQGVAALAAGVAAPFALNKGMQAGAAINRLAAPRAAQPIQVDVKIDAALQPSGLTIGDLPDNIRSAIRQDVQKAMKADGMLSPDAIRRLADYRLTGTTPTAATISLDPALVSQQKNLAKLGINSKDQAAQQLGQLENANNRELITGLNRLGADTADDALAGGQKVMNALSNRNDTAKSLIDARYAAARATDGRAAALDPSAFTQRANDLLDDALLGGKLPADVRGLLNRAAEGEMPLTVDVAEQFKTRIGDLQRGTVDMAERKALGLVRQALDDAPLIDGQGQQAINAFNRARSLNRAWMGIVDKTPALQAVRDGIEPDKFVQKFIVGAGEKANVADLEALRKSVKSSPEAMAAVKSQIAAHLKNQALNGAADEVGNLSQSAYNKALNGIGEQKLSMFFNRDELAQLKAIGRVASYEQFQPRGSAVNNSNTAGAAISSVLDRIAGSSILSKIPFGNALAQPAQNIAVGMRSKEALDASNALLLPMLQGPRQPNALMLSPAAFMRPEEERR